MILTRIRPMLLTITLLVFANMVRATCGFEYIFTPSGNETSETLVINCCWQCSGTAYVWVQSCGGADYVVIQEETYPGSREWNTVCTVNPSTCTGQATGSFTAHVDNTYRIVNYIGTCGGGDPVIDLYFNTNPNAGNCP